MEELQEAEGFRQRGDAMREVVEDGKVVSNEQNNNPKQYQSPNNPKQYESVNFNPPGKNLPSYNGTSQKNPPNNPEINPNPNKEIGENFKSEIQIKPGNKEKDLTEYNKDKDSNQINPEVQPANLDFKINYHDDEKPQIDKDEDVKPK